MVTKIVKNFLGEIIKKCITISIPNIFLYFDE